MCNVLNISKPYEQHLCRHSVHYVGYNLKLNILFSEGKGKIKQFYLNTLYRIIVVMLSFITL